MRLPLAVFALALALPAPLLSADVAQAGVSAGVVESGGPGAGASIAVLDRSGRSLGSTDDGALAAGATLTVRVADGEGIVLGNARGRRVNAATGATAAGAFSWPGNVLSIGAEAGGAPNAGAGFSFAAEAAYPGLLSGSMGKNDMLDLLRDGVVLGGIAGARLAAAATGHAGSPTGYSMQTGGASGGGGPAGTLGFSPSLAAADVLASPQAQPVPEPGALALLGSALAAMLLLRRRRA